MKYIVPDAMEFSTSNAIEETLDEWIPKAYNEGDEVKVSADKKKYKFSGADGVQSTITPSLDPDLWVSAPLNQYAMFVGTKSTETTNADTINTVFKAKNIDTISLFNVSAKSVEIKLKHNLITTENVGAGNGVLTVFSTTTNVLPFSGFIEIWVNGVKEAEDINGDGLFEDAAGSYVASGTVDYTTGSFTVNFSSPIANAQVVEVKYNALVYSVVQDLTYDDLNSFGDYLYTEQELRDTLTSILPVSMLNEVVNAMTEEQIYAQFTANPPIYHDVDIHLNIINTGDIAKCGYVVVGRKRDLGASAIDGFKLGLKTTATRERDIWGDTTLTAGSGYDLMDVPVFIKDVQVDVVKSRLKKNMGTPIVAIADDSDNPMYKSASIYGFFFDLEIPIHPAATKYNLRVESLI